MSAGWPSALACLGCGADLSWAAGVDGTIDGRDVVVHLAPVSYTIVTIDGVPIAGGVDRDDPRYELTRAASPFCRACFDARMARAVELT